MDIGFTGGLQSAANSPMPIVSLVTMMKKILVRKFTRESLNDYLVRHACYDITLDIGCGSSPYAKHFPCRVGIDIKLRPGVNVIADTCFLPFKDGMFPVVLCTEVLEHVAYPENALSEMRRILRPGGKLLLTTRFIFPIHDAPHDFYRFTKYGLRHLLRDFDIRELKPELNTIATIAALVQRIAFQTDLRGGKITRAIVLTFGLIIKGLGGLLRREYGDYSRSIPEKDILASGYFIIATKPGNR